MQIDRDKSAEKDAKMSYIQKYGVFVRALLNGLPMNCLVDTGATLTIIATKVW